VGFINALLRRLAAGDIPPLPRLDDDPVLALSLSTSHPTWLVQRWLGRCGLESTQARLTANNQVPPLTIRVNTLKTDPETLKARLVGEGAQVLPCRLSPVGLHLVELQASPLEFPSYRQGLWLFQDEAAQLVTFLLAARPGHRVLEVGCGRGGKTTHLAEALAQKGLILAVDLHQARLRDLKLNLKRCEATVAQPLRADATSLPLQGGTMDAALVDAPCSALGILRRHPEIKGRLKLTDLATFPPRQRALLNGAAASLRAGGRLLYVTCTTEPEENEELVDAFLAGHPEFRLATDPGALPPPARHLVQPPGFFRTSPEKDNLDAFFAALLVRA
jgi:16S rRNA (cytosine967-C5)-methyltransferase